MAKVLDEKDFIHEEYGQNPFPFWVWLAVIVSLSCLILGASFLYHSALARQFEQNPFLQVTNRQISLFLWQNPQHMRVHVKHKNGYLPAFEYAEKIGLNPDYADDFAIAPPELLFSYHTWNRLLGNIVIPRVIKSSEFRTFIAATPEWKPDYWKDAPTGFVNLMENLNSQNEFNLQLLSFDTLPLAVRQAFLGWKNYYFEGRQINSFSPTQDLLKEFIAAYPHYGRNFWCNLVGDSYLKSFTENPDNPIDSFQLSAELKAALYNFQQFRLSN